jgi:hypothetical protein
MPTAIVNGGSPIESTDTDRPRSSLWVVVKAAGCVGLAGLGAGASSAVVGFGRGFGAGAAVRGREVGFGVGFGVGVGVAAGRLVGAGVGAGVVPGFGLCVPFGAARATPPSPSFDVDVARADAPNPAVSANITASDASEILARFDIGLTPRTMPSARALVGYP